MEIYFQICVLFFIGYDCSSHLKDITTCETNRIKPYFPSYRISGTDFKEIKTRDKRNANSSINNSGPPLIQHVYYPGIRNLQYWKKSFARNPNEDYDNSVTRIINGNRVKVKGSWPWLLSLQSCTDCHFCGGSIF